MSGGTGVTGGNPWARILGKPAASGGGNESGSSGISSGGSTNEGQGGRGISPGGRAEPADAGNRENGKLLQPDGKRAGGNRPDENGNRPDAGRNPAGEGSGEETGATGAAEQNGSGGVAEPVISINVDGAPKKRGRPRKADGQPDREPAKPRKPAKKKYSEDKALMERLIEGVKVLGDIADMCVHYGMGIRPGIWKMNDFQAEVFARILARRADAGNAAAIEQLENVVDWADYVAAAGIGIEKIVETVMEVKENGFNPFFLKAPAANGTDKQSGR